jgi:AcrR family transcriptional regulator
MPRLSRERLDLRRQHILHAAAACFAREGFHRTTIADVRREANVSTGAIYTYFANKEAIIRAMLEHARDERRTQLAAPIASASARARAGTAAHEARVLLDWARAIFSEQGRHAARVDVNLWAESLRSKRVAKIAHSALSEAVTAVGAVVEGGTRGTRKTSERERDAVAAVLVAIFLGLEVQTAVGLELDSEAVVRVLGELFGNAPAPRGKRAARDRPRAKE